MLTMLRCAVGKSLHPHPNSALAPVLYTYKPTPRATPLPLFLKGSIDLNAKMFMKDLRWERTRTGWWCGSEAARPFNCHWINIKLLSLWNLRLVAPKLFTHLECHFVINTETKNIITQLMCLCAHSKPPTGTWVLVSLLLCNSLILLEYSRSITGNRETEVPTSSLHINSAARETFMKSLSYW